MIIPVIPFPLHMAALVGLCVFAALRGSSFPLKLTVLYAALFFLTGYAQEDNYLIENQIKFSALCAFALCEYARRGPSIRFIKRFRAIMILSIGSSILMYSLKDLTEDAYLIAQLITSVLTIVFSTTEFLLLVAINGTNRSDPIYTKLGRLLIHGWNGFRPDYQAVPAVFWQAGTKINNQTERT